MDQAESSEPVGPIAAGGPAALGLGAALARPLSPAPPAGLKGLRQHLTGVVRT